MTKRERAIGLRNLALRAVNAHGQWEGLHPKVLNRRAASTAGASVNRFIIGVFVFSGMLTALSGGLLSYGLAAASPVALTDALVPATAAAIIGGVSLSGGKGTPIGIAGGVLVLSVLRSGLTAMGVLPFVQDLLTGLVLLTVALLDAPGLDERIFAVRRLLKH